MKIISVILAFVILILSAIPCDDIAPVEGDAMASIQYDTSTVDSTSEHSEEHKESDLCSPFCTCVCCSSIVLKPVLSYPNLVSETPSSLLITDYSELFSNDYLSKIFQPPQV